jgi:hypothetical protein
MNLPENTSLRFPILSTERYLNVVAKTHEQVRNQLQMPVLATFTAQTVSKYPRWFTVLTLTALTAVLLLSFWVSSGKQIAAMGLILDHLPAKYSHLSTLWADVSIGAMMLLSELGAILFLVASGTVAADSQRVTIWRLTFRPSVWLLRFFAGLCAAFAILSNISITILDPVPSVALLQLLVSGGIPAIVLGLGVLLEMIITESLRSRNEVKAAFQTALNEYQAIHADPTKHASYNLMFADNEWAELLRYKKDRDLIEPLVNADPRYKKLIIVTEYRAHQDQIDFSLDAGDTPNFLLPAA